MQAAKRQSHLRLRGIGVTKVRVQVREKVSMLPGPAIPRHTVASNKPTVTRWMRRIKSAIRSSPLSAAVVVGNFHRDRDYERTNGASSIVGCRVKDTCFAGLSLPSCDDPPMNVRLRDGAFRHGVCWWCDTFLQCSSLISWRRKGMKKCSD